MRIFKDLQLLFPSLIGPARVLNVHKTVEMKSSGNDQRREREERDGRKVRKIRKVRKRDD